MSDPQIVAPAAPAPKPWGLIVLSLAAAVLGGLLLANAIDKPAGGGEALMAQAYEAVYLTFGLWLVLVLMTVNGGVMGSMPRWVGWLAVLLLPMAGIATLVAVDMCSRNMAWAIVLVALLPALVFFYAWWARLPRLQAKLPPGSASAILWSTVFLLSALTFAVAYYF